MISQPHITSHQIRCCTSVHNFSGSDNDLQLQRHLLLPTTQKLESFALFVLCVPSKVVPHGAAAEHDLDRTLHPVSRSDAQTSDGFQRFLPHWSMTVCRSILPRAPIGTRKPLLFSMNLRSLRRGCPDILERLTGWMGQRCYPCLCDASFFAGRRPQPA